MTIEQLCLSGFFHSLNTVFSYNFFFNTFVCTTALVFSLWPLTTAKGVQFPASQRGIHVGNGITGTGLSASFSVFPDNIFPLMLNIHFSFIHNRRCTI